MVGVTFIVLAAFAMHLLPNPLRGAGDESGWAFPALIRGGSKIRQPWCAYNRWHCAAYTGSAAAGRLAESRTARSPVDRARGQRPFRIDHCISDEPRSPRPP